MPGAGGGHNCGGDAKAQLEGSIKYTLIWHPTAQEESTSLWTVGPDRDAIAAAANIVDPTLSNDPILRGEFFSANTRVLVEPPLRILYRIFEEDRIVKVLAVLRGELNDEK